MKYLKLFDSDSQYSDFINSEEYTLPNVSHVVNENIVHFSPIVVPPKEITFTILNYQGEDRTFTAQEGMTWADLVLSEYNVDGWNTSVGSWVYLYDEGTEWSGTGYYIADERGGRIAFGEDVIKANYSYSLYIETWGLGGGGEGSLN